MESREEKIEFPERPWRIFLWEVFLFSLILGLGIIFTLRAIQVLKIEGIQKIPLEPISFWKFIFSFLFTLLIILLIIKFLKFRSEKKNYL